MRLIVEIDRGATCTACGTIGKHTAEQCIERRPRRHRSDERPTCIQALANGYLPTCIECFFEGGHVVLASVFS